MRVMDDFLKLRKELYKQTVRSVELILGRESSGLKNYRKEYNKVFQSKWRACEREVFLQELAQKLIVFVSDFHALQQSQKAQLRLLKSIPWSEPPVVAVEFVEHSQQKALDSFVAGQMSEKDFLAKVQWDNRWGFPWENYRAIFLWAQQNKTRMLALNKGRSGVTSQSLKQRDHFAAEMIHKYRKQNPQTPIMVIYGDLHLAPNHLPLLVEKKLNLKTEDYAVVLQNSEKIYFQMLQKEMDLHVDVIRLTKNYFCLQVVPPWVKWQNYLLYLESHGDVALYSEGEVDFTDHVKKSVEILSKDLGLKINLDPIAVYTAADDDLWNKISQTFSGASRKLFEKKIERSEPFFLPEVQIGFLGRPTVNQSAILAAQILHAELIQLRQTPLHFPEDFERWIWLEAITYFCSKLINPKRKTDTVSDIKNQLAKAQPKDQGREALRLALFQKMDELMRLQGGKALRRQARPKSLAVYAEAARLLGGMLGEKMYHAFRKGWIKKENLVSLIKKPITNESFPVFYFEFLELIDAWPEPFVSKSHKM